MFDTEEEDGAGRPSFITVVGDTTKPRIDLSAFTSEAMLADAMKADAQRKGVPLRRYDPDWKPRHRKGDRLDRDSDDHRKAAEAAAKGLAPVGDLSWLEVQLFDNGPSDGKHAHTRYVLKLTGTAAAAGALVNEDKRALSTTRHAFLSTPKNFLRNLKRKRDRHALSAEERGLADDILADIAAVEPKESRPDTLVGALSTKLHCEGTVRSAGQFAYVVWTDIALQGAAPVEGWRPVVILRQWFRWLDGRTDAARIPLGPPPVIKPGRKATACRWYARQESAEFTRLVERENDPTTPLRDRFQAWADKKAAA